MKEMMKYLKEPETHVYPRTLELIKKYSFPEFDGELYRQANGIRPDGTLTYQRVLIALPKMLTPKMPAVVVPFYCPEWALGMDLETGEVIDDFKGNPTMLHMVRRGYIAVCADTYQLTYAVPKDGNPTPWLTAGKALHADYPEWSGVGKLIADTKLLVDLCEADDRVDSDRIGMVGHSLGGKIALCAGSLDPRVKVILASDPGLCWHRTNWHDPWYWGKERAEMLREAGEEHVDFLAAAAPKPFCLLAGEFDNDESRQLLYDLEGYKDCPERILVVDHRSGHRPPQYAAEAGYCFVDRWLGNDFRK